MKRRYSRSVVYVLNAVFGFIALCVVLLLIRVILLPVFFANTAVNATQSVTTQTFNGTNIIYNYDWFYQQYNDYLALKQKVVEANTAYHNLLATLPKNQGSWTYTEQQEVSQALTVVQGLQFQVQDLVGSYNAHSQEANRSIFKGNNLPQHLTY